MRDEPVILSVRCVARLEDLFRVAVVCVCVCGVMTYLVVARLDCLVRILFVGIMRRYDVR